MNDMQNYDPNNGERINIIELNINERYTGICPDCNKEQEGLYCSDCGTRMSVIEEISNLDEKAKEDDVKVFDKVLGFFGISEVRGKK